MAKLAPRRKPTPRRMFWWMLLTVASAVVGSTAYQTLRVRLGWRGHI